MSWSFLHKYGMNTKSDLQCLLTTDESSAFLVVCQPVCIWYHRSKKQKHFMQKLEQIIDLRT